MKNVDWVEEAKRRFEAKRPSHFTNYNHCCECAEHDETLKAADIDTIGLKELGNPGWDPVCFCSDEGKKYFMPAFVRLALETVKNEFYLEQFLFHLEGDGEENSLYKSCSNPQRQLIASFIEFMINTYTNEIEANLCSDEVLRAYQIWSKGHDERGCVG